MSSWIERLLAKAMDAKRRRGKGETVSGGRLRLRDGPGADGGLPSLGGSMGGWGRFSSWCRSWAEIEKAHK